MKTNKLELFKGVWDDVRVCYEMGYCVSERGQPYGTQAKKALSDLAFGQHAKAVVQDIDRYGRSVARVYVDGLDVNAEMVRLGAAWVYRQYAKDVSLFDVEREAREAKRGIWGLSEAEQVPPWEWRRQH